jgi:hypothetical protein
MKNLARSIAIFLITTYIDANYSYSLNHTTHVAAVEQREAAFGSVAAVEQREAAFGCEAVVNPACTFFLIHRGA